MKVHVVPYNPAWKKRFEDEADQVSSALGEVVVAVHHIGSTAIPGIDAKPIIDILLEVDSIGRLDARSSALEGLGYEAMGEFGIPSRRYFRKRNSSGTWTHHIHAFQRGSADIDRHLAFRDYMIAHSADAQAYGELKRKLSLEHPDDMEAYIEGKEPFIREHQARAAVWVSTRSAK